MCTLGYILDVGADQRGDNGKHDNIPGLVQIAAYPEKRNYSDGKTPHENLFSLPGGILLSLSLLPPTIAFSFSSCLILLLPQPLPLPPPLASSACSPSPFSSSSSFPGIRALFGRINAVII